MRIDKKESIFALAQASGLFALCRKITAGKLRILCYHGIWLGSGHWGNFLFMSAQRFRRRLRLIQDWGFEVISLSDAMAAMDADALPDNALVITIDDGWYGSRKHMFPALAQAGMPFTLYAYTLPILRGTPVFNVLAQYLLSRGKPVTVDLSAIFPDQQETIDLRDPTSRSQAAGKIAALLDTAVNNEADWENQLLDLGARLGVDAAALLQHRVFHLMTTDELRQVSEFGGTVELHTHDHRLDFDSRGQIDRTISENRRHLEQLLGGNYVHFCYPSGIYRPDAFSDLSELGIASATITDPGLVDRETHRLALPRICDGENMSERAFRAELSGTLEVKRRIQSRLQS